MLLSVIKVILNLTLMVFVISPVLILIYSPFYLYRLLIILLAKVLKPDLEQIVPARDALFANDHFQTKPDCTILGVLRFDGDLKADDVIKCLSVLFENNVSDKASGSDKGTRYSGLKQYFVPWGGFMFRKWEQGFSITDHVTEWRKEDSSSVTEADLYELRRKMLKDPYREGTCPWEMKVIRNCEPSKHQMYNEHDLEKGKVYCIIVTHSAHEISPPPSPISNLYNCETSSPDRVFIVYFAHDTYLVFTRVL